MADTATLEAKPEEAPAKPEPTPEPARPSTFGDLSTQIMGAAKERTAAREKEREGLAASAEAQKPAIAKAIEAQQAPMPVQPQPVKLPEVPGLGLREYLRPTGKEAPEQVIASLISATSVFAAGIAGLAKKDARGGLAALTGAMKGWREGNLDAASLAFKEWDAKTSRAIQSARQEHQAYRDALEARGLGAESALTVAKLKALEQGNDQAVRAFDTQTADQGLQFLTQQQTHMDAVEQKRAALAQAWTNAELNRAQRQSFSDSMRALQREMFEWKKENQGDKPHHGLYWDREQGAMREISDAEWRANNETQKAGQSGRFTALTDPGTPNLLRRIALAPPMIDRLKVLIDRILKEAPGENLTQGVINKLKLKAGIGEDIQEFTNLNVDLLVELTGSLSGGQPRIAILRLLKGEGLPNDHMTKDVARKSVETVATTINNRIVDITQDDGAMAKLAKHQKSYTDSPTQAAKQGAMPEGMPDPATNRHKIAVTKQGKRYRSDGTTWTEIRD